MKIAESIFIFFIKMLSIALNIMPHRVFLWHVYSLSFIFRMLDRRRKNDIYSNLNFVFPNMDSDQKDAIVKKCYDNFAFALLESTKVLSMEQKKHLERFDIVDEKYLLQCLDAQGSAIIISAHFGYWEALTTALPKRYKNVNMASLGRMTGLHGVDTLMTRSREQYGAKLIDKKGSVKKLLEMYRRGSALTGILVDQNIDINEGVLIKFFGHDATHTSIASVLSRRFNVGIVPTFCYMNDDYTRFKIQFYPPIYTSKSEDSKADILHTTQKQADITEQVIRENISSWFWFHKRYKNTYPEIYK